MKGPAPATAALCAAFHNKGVRLLGRKNTFLVCVQERADSTSGGLKEESWSDPSLWNPMLTNTTWSSLHSNCQDAVWLEVRT